MRRVWWMAAIVVAGAVTRPMAAGPAYGSTPASVLREAGSVTAVSLRSSAGRAEVTIAFSGTVEVQDFALAAPHRIVIDVTPATLKLPMQLYDGIVRAGITNVRVAQFRNDVVRVVLDLDGERAYDVVRSSGDVRISLAAATPFDGWALGVSAPPAPLAPPAVASPLGPVSAPVITAVSRALANAPPPKALSAVPQQQTPGRRISISFRDTPLLEVLAVFSDLSGHSIIPSDKVRNVRVNADIIDQPWEIALNAVLQSLGLAATFSQSGIIVIDSQANLATQLASEALDRRVIPLNYARAVDLAPTIEKLLSRSCGTGSVQIIGGAPAPGAAADAAAGAAAGAAGGDAGAAAGAAGGPPPTPPQQAAAPTVISTPIPSNQSCPARGSVVPEVPSNSLIITEIASGIDQLIEYAQSFDFRIPQVNIKAKIISINTTETQRLGVSYDLGSANAFFNTLAPRTGATVGSEFQVQLGGDAFAGVANAGRSFGADAALNLIYNTTLGNFSLTSFIDALHSQELADIQSDPSVNTIDKKAAELFVGDRVAFLLTPPTAPGAIQATAAQISSIEVGIKLLVTPSIAANRTVRLVVEAEQSNLLSVTAAGPNVSTRRAANEVIVNDGETLVIAGLTQTQVTKTRRGIPLLMDLPMIGRLFSEREDIERKSDLLILITPHILDDYIPPKGGNH